ncbi:MAG: hypothetical protein S4CHLAM7_00650 [Chlamydiae bacterium]|nr:hypothetical protein [Chlamydiota bacterium]
MKVTPNTAPFFEKKIIADQEPTTKYSFLKSEEERLQTSMIPLFQFMLIPALAQKLLKEPPTQLLATYYPISASMLTQVAYISLTTVTNIFLRYCLEKSKDEEYRMPLPDIINRSTKNSLHFNYMQKATTTTIGHTKFLINAAANTLGAQTNWTYYPLAILTAPVSLVGMALGSILVTNIIERTGVFNFVFDSIDYLTGTTIPETDNSPVVT